ncbi:hypothetical protein UFOVP192_27 [uncultured Caudovirales phage]|uniref:Uncharacterized protein n=1 Tax=uncultured Caudovirales phage TaxID=2100421 RepID=A0A6J7WEV6_9CAUD|nr:hypothetical protein UFOVP192_27 [uncultured Caudovirales phage]
MPISTSGISVPQLGSTGGIDSSIYGNQQAPQGMSLRDLVSLSRENIALQKEKALLEPSIAAGKAQSETAQVGAQKAKLGLATDFADKMRQQQIALINNPIIVRAEQDPQFAAANKDKITQLVNQQAKAATELGLDPAKAAELNAPYLETVTQTNGQGLRQFLKTRMIAGLDQTAQANLNPAQFYQAAPEAPAAPAGSPAGGAVEPFSQPEKLSYPIPRAGEPRAQLPSEEGDRQFGEKARLGLTAMQQSYPAIRQNYDKLIDQTQKVAGDTIFGGAAGTAERALKAKIGTPEYQQLSKDLANAQIAQIKAEGGSLDTVAGQSLAAHANGSVTYDPAVLLDIARRNAANLENKNAQANGLRVASEKFGDANSKHFLSMWNKNANDNSVFEMKYIFSHAKTPEDGAAQIAKYIKESGFSEAKRKELATKYLNLQKLETTGTL